MPGAVTACIHYNGLPELLRWRYLKEGATKTEIVSKIKFRKWTKKQNFLENLITRIVYPRIVPVKISELN